MSNLHKLTDIVKFIGGSQPPKSVFSDTKEDGYVRLIQIRDYKSDNHIVYINKDSTRKFCTKDDIMIGRYGPPVFQILRGIEGAYNVALMKAEPKNDKLSKEYLYRFLQNPSIQNYIIGLSQRSAGQSGVNKEALEQYEMLLPPLSEQKRIVSKLDKLFEKIDKGIVLHQKNMDESDLFMGSVLNDVFGELEEKYETTSLDTLSSFQNGFAFKSKEFNTDELGLRVIRIGNVLDINKNPVFIDERKEFKKYLLKENDIVISMTGTRKKMDYLFVRVVDTNDSYLNQRVGKILAKDNSNHRYLYYYLQSNYFRDKIFEYETGTVNQGNISGKDIMNSKIPLISLDIQKKAVKYLDKISQNLEKLKQAQKEKMESLKTLKASILDKAFRGEL